MTSWTLSIMNEAETVYRTFTGFERTFDVVWDGTDDFSALVPDGTYTYQIDAENADTSE
jgi:flagellar hook assembly protein FlgD